MRTSNHFFTWGCGVLRKSKNKEEKKRERRGKKLKEGMNEGYWHRGGGRDQRERGNRQLGTFWWQVLFHARPEL